MNQWILPISHIFRLPRPPARRTSFQRQCGSCDLCLSPWLWVKIGYLNNQTVNTKNTLESVISQGLKFDPSPHVWMVEQHDVLQCFPANSVTKKETHNKTTEPELAVTSDKRCFEVTIHYRENVYTDVYLIYILSTALPVVGPLPVTVHTTCMYIYIHIGRCYRKYKYLRLKAISV